MGRQRHGDLQLALFAMGEISGQHQSPLAETHGVQNFARGFRQLGIRGRAIQNLKLCPACAWIDKATFSSAVKSRNTLVT